MKQYNEVVSKRKKQITIKLELNYLDYMLVYRSLNSVSSASLSIMLFEDIRLHYHSNCS